MALHCSSSILANLTTFVRNCNSSGSGSKAGQAAAATVAGGSRAGASTQQGPVQLQLLRLLQGMTKAAGTAGDGLAQQRPAAAGSNSQPSAAAAAATAAAAGADTGSTDEEEEEFLIARRPTRGSSKQGRVTTAAAAAGSTASVAAAVGIHDRPASRRQAGSRGLAAAAAAGVSCCGAGLKRSRAVSGSPVSKGSGGFDAPALQQLLQERQKDVLAVKQLNK
jgi:hypothetical protein